VVKFSPLSERLAGLVPPERISDALERPGGEDQVRRASTPRNAAQPAQDDISSTAEIEQAQRNVRSALARFGREAPGRRAASDHPEPPGRVLDIRV